MLEAIAALAGGPDLLARHQRFRQGDVVQEIRCPWLT
jgi:hypothetical protein